MIGTLLNVLAVLAGGFVGRLTTWNPSAVNQSALKVVLGLFTVWTGLSTVWASLNGTFLEALGMLGIALLALMLGNLTGKLLRLQHHLNRLGRHARDQFTQCAASGRSPGFATAFLSCSVFFAANPLGIFGAVIDGTAGNWKILAVKSAMDGLSSLSFARTLGWGSLAAVVPLAAIQGSVTLAGHALADWLAPAQLDALGATAGLMVFSVSLIIFELRKIELADYLPSLVYAPLLAAFLRS